MLVHNLHKINEIKILFLTIQTKASNPVGGVQATETGATLHSAVEGIHINRKRGAEAHIWPSRADTTADLWS